MTEQKLAEGEIAFMFGGNWDWSVLNQYDYTENMGLMPVPQNTDDGSNEKLVGGGSKYFRQTVQGGECAGKTVWEQAKEMATRPSRTIRPQSR